VPTMRENTVKRKKKQCIGGNQPVDSGHRQKIMTEKKTELAKEKKEQSVRSMGGREKGELNN